MFSKVMERKIISVLLIVYFTLLWNILAQLNEFSVSKSFSNLNLSMNSIKQNNFEPKMLFSKQYKKQSTL